MSGRGGGGSEEDGCGVVFEVLQDVTCELVMVDTDRFTINAGGEAMGPAVKHILKRDVSLLCPQHNPVCYSLTLLPAEKTRAHACKLILASRSCQESEQTESYTRGTPLSTTYGSHQDKSQLGSLRGQLTSRHRRVRLGRSPLGRERDET